MFSSLRCIPGAWLCKCYNICIICVLMVYAYIYIVIYVVIASVNLIGIVEVCGNYISLSIIC